MVPSGLLGKIIFVLAELSSREGTLGGLALPLIALVVLLLCLEHEVSAVSTYGRDGCQNMAVVPSGEDSVRKIRLTGVNE